MRLQQLRFFGFALLALGCAGGQTGDLSGQKDDGDGTANEGETCAEQRRKLDSLDEQTDLGTAAGLFDFAARSFDAPLTWKTRAGQTWQAGPESGASSIHIEVTPGDSAYYITYETKPDGNGATIDIGCAGAQLGIDARVTVTTEGGALAETFDTTLYSRYPGVATLNVPLRLDALSGELQVSYDDPKVQLVQLGLTATLLEAGTSGSIAGIEQTNLGEAVSAGAAVLAVWPDSPACGAEPYANPSGIGVGPEQNALGITGSAAAELLSATTPATVTWRDGSSTELTLGVTLDGDGCLRTSTFGFDGGSETSYPAHFNLSSADGRLSASYAGALRTSPSGDGNSVHGEASLELELEQVAQSGFSSVTVPATAERLIAQLQVDVDGAGQVTGQVRLNGLVDPPCLTNPPPPQPEPGGGSSSPGCAGTSVTTIESASWGVAE